MKRDAAVVAKASMYNQCYHCASNLPKDHGQLFCYCPNCEKLQASHITDPFVIYGLEPSFDVDMAALEHKYFALQMQFHPDKFVTKSEQEKLHASQISMNINDAYQLLSDPIRRADYLLVQQDFSSIQQESNVQISPILLMEQMEQREKLEQANDMQGLMVLYKENKAATDDIMGKIAQAFTQEQYVDVQQQLLRLQYTQKLLQQIQAKQRNM